MRWNRISSGLALGFALMPLARTQHYGTSLSYADNMIHTLGITGFPSAGHLISGTNVSFGVETISGINIVWPTQPYNSFQITEAKLEFTGGGQPETVPLISAPLAFGVSLQKGIRIASTHFNDQADLTISLKVKIKNLQLDGSTVLQSGPVIEYTSVVVPKVHNQVMAWGSQNGLYSILDCQQAKGKIGSGSEPKHSYIQAGPVNDFLGDEGDLTQRLNYITFVHTSAHGNETGVSDSFSGILSWADIANAVGDDRTVPDPNIVISYACSTIAIPNVAAVGFRIMEVINGVATIRTNRALAGFDVDILTGTDSQTYEHARILYEGLRDGMHIEDAVDAANKAVPLYRSDIDDGVWIKMKINGDLKAKIRGVYRQGIGSAAYPLDTDWIVIL